METNQESVEVTEECVCEICNGNGVVPVYEQVTPDEPQTALVGERACDCQEEEVVDFEVQ